MEALIKTLMISLFLIGLACIIVAQYISRFKNHDPFFDFAFSPLFWVGAIIMLLSFSVGSFLETKGALITKIISTVLSSVSAYCIIKIYLLKKYTANEQAIKPLLFASIVSGIFSVILIITTIT